MEGQSETGEHTVWELELDETEQTLITNCPRPRKLNMIFSVYSTTLRAWIIASTSAVKTTRRRVSREKADRRAVCKVS